VDAILRPNTDPYLVGSNSGSSLTRRTAADHSRAHSQSDEILQMLRVAGESGCTNLELWTVAHAAHSRIADLRARGHRITCERERIGVYRYVLLGEPESPIPSYRRLPLFDGLEAGG
jgi:hypothetical protein